MEKRILFRLLSGLHSSIMTQIANDYRFDGERLVSGCRGVDMLLQDGGGVCVLPGGWVGQRATWLCFCSVGLCLFSTLNLTVGLKFGGTPPSGWEWPY